MLAAGRAFALGGLLLALPSAALADPRVPSPAEAAHGPFPLVVVDGRQVAPQAAGTYPGEDGLVPWTFDEPVGDWLARVVASGLSQVGVQATLVDEGGEGPGFRLDVDAFWCDAGACRWTLRLSGRSDAWQEVWSQDASVPFHPEGEASADLIGAAAAWHIADGLRSVELPGALAPEGYAPAEEVPPPAIISSSGPIGGGVAGPPTPPPTRSPPPSIDRAAYADFDEDGYVQGMRLLGPPVHLDCVDSRSEAPSRIARRERFGDLLATDPEKAWKELRRFGPEGAELIAWWLKDGANGARSNHIRDAAEWVLKCAPRDRWQPALRYRSFAQDPVGILVEVRGRIPRFTPDRAFWFVDHAKGAARAEGAAALVGGHQSYTVLGWGSFGAERGNVDELAPPPHHLDAVRTLLFEDPDERVWVRTVRSIGALYAAGVPGQEAWRSFVVDMLRDAPADWETVFEEGARAVGRAPCEGQPDVTESVLDVPLPDAHLAYVEGFAGQYAEAGPAACMVEPLRAMATRGLGVSRVDAAALLEKMGEPVE